MINLDRDWENRPVKCTLKPEEHQRLLEVFEQQALERRREAEAAEQTLISVALALKVGAR